ncbi:6-phosphogluconate dehydrogenase NAD-binding protein [Kribbella flavida DSM 17836]|uniref:6-phosphogluconate dehydrogenase NAD-binding protein n=1 Tax=Kribbella flavida (strain DSM 17836 / JCM 10339 / NBRC 14399) TaxID=479435 RepID=D2PMU7_KRIFD|nr:NAD(P)-dependent oxidoreductase [Kribbella flavida]ADB32649.1 6-phosphogluconate dehydrogenase NAD-binding protein [Kribbella flavida DSM 17836]
MAPPIDRTITVGFAGLGNLGRPMTEALGRDGWQLKVYDQEPAKGEGLELVEGPAELAGCAVIALAVPDDEAVTAILTELLPLLAAESVVLIHSTVLPATAQRLARQAEEHGIGLLDVPVSGGAERALTGSLTVMAGGRAEVLEQARPVLESVADTVLHVGPAGAGAAVKLANQLMMFAALAGAQEALDLAGAYGVPEQTVLDAVATSTGDSWVSRNWGFFDRVAAAYDTAGTPVRNRPWSKDLWDVVAAAREADVQVPLAGLLAQHLADQVEAHARKGSAS